MKLPPGAKIYLASERGHTETDWFRSYNTFNFGGYQNEYRRPFGTLYVWNDDTLAGGRSFQLLIENDSLLLLLPVVGAVEYRDSQGNENVINAGQAHLIFVKKGTTVHLRNPYEDELINFLQAWFTTTAPEEFPTRPTNFLLDKKRNRLIKIITHPKLNCVIGKYDGRKDDVFHTTDRHSQVFVFVLQGAFEVQDRLLETRDGLGLWGETEIAFEALSNEAILLIAEMKTKA